MFSEGIKKTAIPAVITSCSHACLKAWFLSNYAKKENRPCRRDRSSLRLSASLLTQTHPTRAPSQGRSPVAYFAFVLSTAAPTVADSDRVPIASHMKRADNLTILLMLILSRRLFSVNSRRRLCPAKGQTTLAGNRVHNPLNAC